MTAYIAVSAPDLADGEELEDRRGITKSNGCRLTGLGRE
jgi:hypothetical protein